MLVVLIEDMQTTWPLTLLWPANRKLNADRAKLFLFTVLQNIARILCPENSARYSLDIDVISYRVKVVTPNRNKAKQAKFRVQLRRGSAAVTWLLVLAWVRRFLAFLPLGVPVLKLNSDCEIVYKSIYSADQKDQKIFFFPNFQVMTTVTSV